MHGDITPTNILPIEHNPSKSQPERAVLCDFGEICLERRDANTVIAYWYYLPPEVVEFSSNTYDQSIDVWMLAHALVYIRYRQALAKAPRRPSGQSTLTGIDVLRADVSKEKFDLAHLLHCMLDPRPKNRLNKLEANGPGNNLKRETRLPKWAPVQPSSPLHLRTDVRTLRNSRSLGGKFIC